MTDTLYDWRSNANCVDSRYHYAPEKEDKRQRRAREFMAQMICEQCTAYVECREFALTTVPNNDRNYYAGMGQAQRIRERIEREVR
jgi:hypothetical protein